MCKLYYSRPCSKRKENILLIDITDFFFLFENPFELTEVVIRHIIVTFDIFCEQNLSQCGKR